MLLVLLQPQDSILKGIISARIFGRMPNPVDTASSLQSNAGWMRAFTFRARSSVDVQCVLVISDDRQTECP